MQGEKMLVMGLESLPFVALLKKGSHAKGQTIANAFDTLINVKSIVLKSFF